MPTTYSCPGIHYDVANGNVQGVADNAATDKEAHKQAWLDAQNKSRDAARSVEGNYCCEGPCEEWYHVDIIRLTQTPPERRAGGWHAEVDVKWHLNLKCELPVSSEEPDNGDGSRSAIEVEHRRTTRRPRSRSSMRKK
jgi:hypothetical protein